MKTDSKCQISRRNFIKLGTAAIGMLAATRLSVAFGAESVWVAIGSEADFELDQPVLVSGGKAFVVRRAAGLQALSARCTHGSCKVSWQGGRFVCPCHQARFGLDGEVLKGPARAPLPAIPVKTEGGQVLLQV